MSGTNSESSGDQFYEADEVAFSQFDDNEQADQRGSDSERTADSGVSMTSSIQELIGDADENLRLGQDILCAVFNDDPYSPKVLLVDHFRFSRLITFQAEIDKHDEEEPDHPDTPQALVLTRDDRLANIIPSSTSDSPSGPASLHPSKLKALYVQSYGTTVLRPGQPCEFCSRDNTDGPFVQCKSGVGVGGGACGNCLWNHNAVGCSCKFHILTVQIKHMLIL